MSYQFGWVPPPNVIGSHTWVDCSGGYVPPEAVKAGQDEDGGVVYVGRAMHLEDVVPGKVCPTHGCAFIGYGGEELSKPNYQVLCSSHIAWKPTERDAIPGQAIECGRTAEGERLYVGRTIVNGRMVPGKVHPSHQCLYVPYGGQEISHSEYEILILY